METRNPYAVLAVVIIALIYVFYSRHQAAQLEKEMIENSRIVIEEALSKWEAGEPHATHFHIVPSYLVENSGTPTLKEYEIKQVRKIFKKGNDGSFGDIEGDADVYLKVELMTGEELEANVKYSFRYDIANKTCRGFARPIR